MNTSNTNSNTTNSSEPSISPKILETMLLRKYQLLENDYNNTINASNKQEIIIVDIIFFQFFIILQPLREQLKNEIELNKLEEQNDNMIENDTNNITEVKKEEPLPLGINFIFYFYQIRKHQ